MAKNMFSSKGRRRALDEEDNEKKGSFLGKLNIWILFLYHKNISSFNLPIV